MNTPASPRIAWGRTLYHLVMWFFIACLMVQFFLAGLGVFAGPGNFVVHRDFAYLFGWLAVIATILAVVGGMGRRFILLTLLIVGLMALQSVFVLLRGSSPAIAALHPVNGVLILLLSLKLALDARELVPPPLGTARANGVSGRPN
jgi:hypothetical protein